jgi:hypothetical protein
MKRILGVALILLTLAPAPYAKGPLTAQICGASNCVTVRDTRQGLYGCALECLLHLPRPSLARAVLHGARFDRETS